MGGAHVLISRSQDCFDNLTVMDNLVLFFITLEV